MSKKHSLNLAAYHASISSNLTPYYRDSQAVESRFDAVVKTTKNGRKKRSRRKASRVYLYDCPCEKQFITKTEKTREIKAAIRFPSPKGITDMEREESYTFRFDTQGKEYTKDDALRLVRKKFFAWCRHRGFDTMVKCSLSTIDGDFHFIVERAPDMRIVPTKSISSI